MNGTCNDKETAFLWIVIFVMNVNIQGQASPLDPRSYFHVHVNQPYLHEYFVKNLFGCPWECRVSYIILCYLFSLVWYLIVHYELTAVKLVLSWPWRLSMIKRYQICTFMYQLCCYFQCNIWYPTNVNSFVGGLWNVYMSISLKRIDSFKMAW